MTNCKSSTTGHLLMSPIGVYRTLEQQKLRWDRFIEINWRAKNKRFAQERINSRLGDASLVMKSALSKGARNDRTEIFVLNNYPSFTPYFTQILSLLPFSAFQAPLSPPSQRLFRYRHLVPCLCHKSIHPWW